MGRIVRHELVDSTSERAFAALAEGSARDGDVHVARGQRAGRGRLGRPWQSAPGEGLYLSLIHMPRVLGSPPTLTMAAGLALFDTLRAEGLAGARLDWPNDLVVGRPEAKLAGILVESRALDPARPRFVIGIGVNVRQRDFPAALVAERHVTSLALQGIDRQPEQLVTPLAEALGARLAQAAEQPEALARAFLSATELAGRRVEVRCADEVLHGRLVDLDVERGLELESDAGMRRIELAHVHAVDPAPL